MHRSISTIMFDKTTESV